MLDLSQRRRQRQNIQKLPEGVYDSVVTEVRWADGYAPEEAYQITYEITSESGNSYRHIEIFKTNARNLRTIEFENYLSDIGLNNISDFVGKHERLTMGYVTAYNGKEYFNIVDREYVG